MRVIFFGMTGTFSRRPLETLLAGSVDVRAVVLPAAAKTARPRRLEPRRPGPSELPLLDAYLNQNIVHLAWARSIPVWEVGRLADPAVLAMLATLEPEVMIVACFSRLFPPALRRLPRCGCLNLHPSLLPAYRGPAPLFWQARQAERRGGVTLHYLDGVIDTGDIVSQVALDWPEGLAGSQFEAHCAAAGGELLLGAIRALEAGRDLPRQPQPAAGASYFPAPAPGDMIVPTTWPARRAFHFLRGAAGWPLVIQAGPEQMAVREVLACDPAGRLDRPLLPQGDETLIQFTPGVLRVRLYSKTG